MASEIKPYGRFWGGDSSEDSESESESESSSSSEEASDRSSDGSSKSDSDEDAPIHTGFTDSDSSSDEVRVVKPEKVKDVPLFSVQGSGCIRSDAWRSCELCVMNSLKK